MKKIYAYLKYTEFIEDWYHSQKKINPKYTYQKLADDAGFKTNSYIIDVIKGRKDLSAKSIDQVANALKLNKKEGEYFNHLVRFNSSSNNQQKRLYFNKLKQFAHKPEFNHDAVNQYEYYSVWYHSVIRELLTTKTLKGSASKMSKALKPKVSVAKVRKSIDLLKVMGLTHTPTTASQPSLLDSESKLKEVRTLGMVNNHEQNIELALQALHKVPAELRETSCVTASLSLTGFQKVLKKYAQFRKQINQIIQSDENQDRVYQLNMQMFPVTNVSESKD